MLFYILLGTLLSVTLFAASMAARKKHSRIPIKAQNKDRLQQGRRHSHYD